MADNEFDFEANYRAIMTLTAWKVPIYNTAITISLVFKLMVIVFFIYNFAKKVSSCLNFYFYLLFIGFILDIIATITYVMKAYGFQLFGNLYYISYNTLYLLQWYNQNFAEMWTLWLVLNRSTAIIWWQDYDTIWSKHFAKVVIFIFIFPFLIGSWSFFNPQCRFNVLRCAIVDGEYVIKDAMVTLVGNFAVSSLSFLVVLFTVAIFRLKIKKELNIKQSPDWKMLFHGLTSSLSLMAYAGFRLWYEIRLEFASTGIHFGTFTDEIFVFSKEFALVLCNSWSYIFLFVFSTQLRQQFFEFYFISKIFSHCYKRPQKLARVIQISSVAERTLHR